MSQNPLGGDSLHHQIGHFVTVAEMMVKGNGHTIPDSGLFNGLLQRGEQLALPRCIAFTWVAVLGRTPKWVNAPVKGSILPYPSI